MRCPDSPRSGEKSIKSLSVVVLGVHDHGGIVVRKVVDLLHDVLGPGGA